MSWSATCRSGRPEAAAVATLKGDARMAHVLRRAVLSHVARPTGDARHHQGHPAFSRRRAPTPALRRRRTTGRHPLVDRARAVAATARRGCPPASARTRAPRRLMPRRRGIASIARRFGSSSTPYGRHVDAPSLSRHGYTPIRSFLQRCSAAIIEPTTSAPRCAGRQRLDPSGRRAGPSRMRCSIDELVRVARRHCRLSSTSRARRGARPLARCNAGPSPAGAPRFRDRARRSGPGDDTMGTRLVGDHPAAPRPASSRGPPSLTAGYRVPGEVLSVANRLSAVCRRRRCHPRPLCGPAGMP